MNSIQEIEETYNVKWVDSGVLADYYNNSKTELLDNKTNAISKKPGIYRLLLPIELVPEIKFVKPTRPTKNIAGMILNSYKLSWQVVTIIPAAISQLTTKNICLFISAKQTIQIRPYRLD